MGEIWKKYHNYALFPAFVFLWSNVIYLKIIAFALFAIVLFTNIFFSQNRKRDLWLTGKIFGIVLLILGLIYLLTSLFTNFY